jgi:hypothetical protein
MEEQLILLLNTLIRKWPQEVSAWNKLLTHFNSIKFNYLFQCKYFNSNILILIIITITTPLQEISVFVPLGNKEECL